MLHSWRLPVLFAIFAFVNTESEFGEDIAPPYTYSFSNPSALNFRDLYASMVTSAEDKETEMEDDTLISTTEPIYLYKKNKVQYVEFRPEYTTIASLTPPPPKYLVNSTHLDRPFKLKRKTTTEDPSEEELIKVVPVNMERGVLDLLFPESRVKTFKNIFNTIKRMLSHTFRR